MLSTDHARLGLITRTAAIHTLMLSLPCTYFDLRVCKGANVSKNEIALNFDTAEYYSLQEASEYLNRKHKTENITPRKLLKQISSRKINTFIHFRMDNLSSGLFRIQINGYDSNIFSQNKLDHNSHEADLKSLIEITYKLEEFVSNRLIDDLYMGFILFKIDEQTLFNMSLSSKPEDRTLILLFDGFIYNYIPDEDPSKSSQLLQWDITLDNKSYHFTEVNNLSFVIDSTKDDDLKELQEKIPFPCLFEKRNGYSFVSPKIHIKDLIIIHKDLLILEKQIIENVAVSTKQAISINQQNLPKRKGVSPKKVLAQSLARHIADDEWEKDKNKKIKMLEMSNIVWSKLWELGFADTLPEQQRVREWIKGNAPDYAREGGRPRQK